ncbi:MAG: hypothetical protein LQ346_006148 [Caloplaca aetnensis]|nr:MAG: hypothetical protein LQ346_006148 [Caloplaca aetnensis]
MVSKGGAQTDVWRDESVQNSTTPKGEHDATSHEPNLVDFDADDADDPLNWSSRYKWSITILLASMSIIVYVGPSRPPPPLCSSLLQSIWARSESNLAIVMCAPAAPVILDHFDSNNHAYQILLVSIWELGEVFGPFLLASCSEPYGRLPVYHAATVLFILFSVACAASTSLPMLLAFRSLIGMTPPTGTLNAPIIADMFPKEQRGRAISVMQLPGLIGTVVGPAIGSFVTDARGWRWTFWLAAILCGAFECVFAVFYRETYRVRILKDRVEKLKKETANQALRSRYDTGNRTGQVFHEAMIRPFKMLAFSPVIPILGFYAALVYGIHAASAVAATNALKYALGTVPPDHRCTSAWGSGGGTRCWGS